MKMKGKPMNPFTFTADSEDSSSSKVQQTFDAHSAVSAFCSKAHIAILSLLRIAHKSKYRGVSSYNERLL